MILFSTVEECQRKVNKMERKERTERKERKNTELIKEGMKRKNGTKVRYRIKEWTKTGAQK